MRLCECDWELVPVGLRRAGFWPFRESVGWFPVSLQYPIGIPHVSVMFSFILIRKLIHTYLIRIRQYPVSEQYSIPVWQQRAVSALRSLHASVDSPCISCVSCLSKSHDDMVALSYCHDKKCFYFL
jgi:hypothetical protein